MGTIATFERRDHHEQPRCRGGDQYQQSRPLNHAPKRSSVPMPGGCGRPAADGVSGGPTVKFGTPPTLRSGNTVVAYRQCRTAKTQLPGAVTAGRTALGRTDLGQRRDRRQRDDDGMIQMNAHRPQLGTQAAIGSTRRVRSSGTDTAAARIALHRTKEFGFNRVLQDRERDIRAGQERQRDRDSERGLPGGRRRTAQGRLRPGWGGAGLEFARAGESRRQRIQEGDASRLQRPRSRTTDTARLWRNTDHQLLLRLDCYGHVR